VKNTRLAGDAEGTSQRRFPCLARRKTGLFLKILLRGFKRSLISAARPNQSGDSEDEVNEILKKFDLTTKFEQVYVSFAGETSEAGRKTGNVLIVFGTSNWLNFVPVELLKVKSV
jgi:hypothetical protein